MNTHSASDSIGISVREIGSFHVGGKLVSLSGLPSRQRVSTASGPTHPIDPNGEIIVGQLYVQYVRLTARRGASPLLLWHGGGMTGVNWETTPNGRNFEAPTTLPSATTTCIADASAEVA